MNVEDSYEGAVRRLARLGYAGVHIAQHRDENDHRMRELEELATLACDENERLGGELADARREIERLRATVVSLQQQQLAAMVRPPADEIEYAPRKGRSGAFYFVVLAMLGAGAAALFAARPWERGRVAIAMASLDK